MKEIKETTIPATLIAAAKNETWEIGPDFVEAIYQSTIKAISEFLSIKKSKEQKVALSIKDLRDNVLLIAKISYHKGETEDDPGNWSFEMSLNNEDIDLTDTNVFASTDLGFYEVLTRTLRNLINHEFYNTTCANSLTTLAYKVLKQWLDENAIDGQVVETGVDGYFIASVAIEDGEKVMSIVPDGAMKSLAKGDSTLVD